MSTHPRHSKPITDAEEARVQKLIASDPDAPEATDEQLAQAKPFAETFPNLAAGIKRSRGRPKLESPRAHVSLRIDADILERLRATGPGWQSRINEILRDYVNRR